MDQLLSDVQQELLRPFVSKPLIGCRGHVPGDIFSEKTANGRLLMLDADESRDFALRDQSQQLDGDEINEIKLSGPLECLDSLAEFQAGFWYMCNDCSCPDYYLHAHTMAMLQHRIGRLTLVKALTPSPWLINDDHLSKSSKYLLNAFTSCAEEIVENRQSPSLYTSMWLWEPYSKSHALDHHADYITPALRPIVACTTGSTCAFSYINSVNVSDVAFNMLGGAIGEHCKGLDYMLRITGKSKLTGNSFSMIKPWDVWIAMNIEGEPICSSFPAQKGAAEKGHTKIFSSLALTFIGLASSAALSTHDPNKDGDGWSSAYHACYLRVIHMSGNKLVPKKKKLKRRVSIVSGPVYSRCGSSPGILETRGPAEIPRLG